MRTFAAVCAWVTVGATVLYGLAEFVEWWFFRRGHE
jgi:hypothetical protein